jgi:Domain of unknown function (DUF6265)
MNDFPTPPAARCFALAFLFVAAGVGAQTPSNSDQPLAPLAWLDGCWRGTVNEREFREHWMPLRGGLLLGVSQMVMGGKSLGYEFLRIETRSDGIYYVATPSGAAEGAYKFSGRTLDTEGDRNDEVFTFENATLEFPRRIIYRRATGGWLYAQVDGVVKGAERKVIYPMRRIDCATGAFIEK